MLKYSSVRPVGVLVILVFMVGLLTAVGSGQTIELTFATPLATWSEMQAAIEQFEAENPDISVKLITIPDVDSGESVIRFALSGQMPDLFTVHHVSFDALYNEGLLQNLDDLFEKDPEANPADYVGHYMGVSGTYVLPFTVNVWFALYNDSMFQANGLPSPDPQYWDVDQFRNDVFKLTRLFPGGSPLDEWGYGGFAFNLNHVEAWLWPFGATLFDDAGNPAIDTPEMHEALRFWTTFTERGLTKIHNEVRDDWYSGRYGVFFADRATLSILLQSDINFDWGLVHLPIKPGVDRKIVGTGHYFAMSSRTEYPDEVWRLLKWLTGPEGHRVFQSRGLLPGNISAFSLYEEFWETAAYTWNVPKNLYIITEATQYLSPPSFMYTTLPQTEVQPIIADYFRSIILDRSMAPEIGAAEMQRLLTARE